MAVKLAASRYLLLAVLIAAVGVSAQIVRPFFAKPARAALQKLGSLFYKTALYCAHSRRPL